LIFVDTSFLFAGIQPRDRWHSVAKNLVTDLDGILVTTNHIRGETWTLLRARASHRTAVRFLDDLERGRVDVIDVGGDIEASALSWLRRHDERAYSFVDATSFALMREMGITEALAFDGDFAAAGFVELRP